MMHSKRTSVKFLWILGVSLCLPLFVVIILRLWGIIVGRTIHLICLSLVIPASICFFTMIGILIFRRIENRVSVNP